VEVSQFSWNHIRGYCLWQASQKSYSAGLSLKFATQHGLGGVETIISFCRMRYCSELPHVLHSSSIKADEWTIFLYLS
jgi:hypothetical protein